MEIPGDRLSTLGDVTDDVIVVRADDRDVPVLGLQWHLPGLTSGSPHGRSGFGSSIGSFGSKVLEAARFPGTPGSDTVLILNDFPWDGSYDHPKAGDHPLLEHLVLRVCEPIGAHARDVIRRVRRSAIIQENEIPELVVHEIRNAVLVFLVVVPVRVFLSGYAGSRMGRFIELAPGTAENEQ